MIDNLPDVADPEFGARAGAVLADLRRLEGVAGRAARSARGAPENAIALSTVRKRYDELMLRTARSRTPHWGSGFTPPAGAPS